MGMDGEAKIALIGITLMALIGVPIFSCERVCTQRKRVDEIGGCNRDGRCGVRYTDGSFGDEYMPVRTGAYCTQSEMRWKK